MHAAGSDEAVDCQDRQGGEQLPSLFKYLTKELKYSDSEANLRVAAVRLVLREKQVVKKIACGDLSLTNAAEINTSLNQLERETKRTTDKKTLDQAIAIGENKSTRQAKEDLRQALQLDVPRRETIILDEKILAKVDRARAIYGDISAYELLDTLLEEKLKTPHQPLRKSSTTPKVSRSIPLSVKFQVHRGSCAKCGSRRHLQYDHIREHAKGGTNGVENIQVLCSNCNQRKRIKVFGNDLPFRDAISV